MSLVQLADNTRTDKNTVHSYLPLYQMLLEHKRYTATNVLEVGICHGGSIKLWSDFFVNANVYGLDIMDYYHVWGELKNKPSIKLYTSTNAYDPEFFQKEISPVKFDLMLDDGPHTLDSMKQFILLYSQCLADDGILIIEDVQSWDWIKELVDTVPIHLKPYIKSYDLRSNKQRYDDIVFTIDKSDRTPRKLSMQFI